MLVQVSLSINASSHIFNSGSKFCLASCCDVISMCRWQLRNPWGGHEWTGAWNDKGAYPFEYMGCSIEPQMVHTGKLNLDDFPDPRWTDELKKEMNHTDKEDGMFWVASLYSCENANVGLSQRTLVNTISASRRALTQC